MLSLADCSATRRALRVLCLGAHCDDIEIGCGATLLRLAAERHARRHLGRAVFDADAGRRGARSASAFLREARRREVRIETLRDGYLPAQWAQAKDIFESLKAAARPDLDLHARARRPAPGPPLASANSPGTPSATTPSSSTRSRSTTAASASRTSSCRSRVRSRSARSTLLQSRYRSQRDKRWFIGGHLPRADAAARHRMQRRAGLAEAFHARKVVL